MKINPLTLKKLQKAARKSQSQAYAPYSGFQIGASILFRDGKVYSGGNIENASYGATVCAERVAIWKAISERGYSKKQKIDVVYVVSSAAEAWPPCGLCRQVLSEFVHSKTQIVILGQEGEPKVYLFKDLFPEAFSPEFLKSSSR